MADSLLEVDDFLLNPPMTDEYKFQHWSGEEIYPDEQHEYKVKAKNLLCYHVKGFAPESVAPGQSKLSWNFTIPIKDQ